MDHEGRPLLKTMTDEHYQLARLFYRIHNRDQLLKAFSKLNCLSFNLGKQSWEWLYCDEAKKIGLAVPYEKIPVERRPIILGRIYIKSDQEAHLDVNSFQRAVKAVLFLDKHFGKSLFEVTEIEILNKIFDNQVNNAGIHAEYFDARLSPRNTADIFEDRLSKVAATETNPDRKRKLIMEFVENNAKKPLNEIERLPVFFYEDGIAHLEGSLRMREIIAIQHWLGKKDYSFFDLVQSIIPHMEKNSPLDSFSR